MATIQNKFMWNYVYVVCIRFTFLRENYFYQYYQWQLLKKKKEIFYILKYGCIKDGLNVSYIFDTSVA